VARRKYDAQQDQIQRKTEKTVLAAGICVYPHAKFLASKPDGIIKNKDNIPYPDRKSDGQLLNCT
jgi:hypothetical protein